MRKCAECTTFFWHKQQFWDTWGRLIVLIRVSVSPQFAVNSPPLVSIVTEQCVGENGEKDNLPHNGKNTETSRMCSRFKMWSWRHMFIRIGWQKNDRFYQREWWTFKCCSICVVIYCVVLSPLTANPQKLLHDQVNYMTPWVRRVTGGRRIVATRSSCVLLPAVLLKSRVKCLRAPNTGSLRLLREGPLHGSKTEKPEGHCSPA